MTTDPVDSLDDLAAKVDACFASQRHSDGFKSISLVIDSSRSGRSTPIVYIDSEDASLLADDVEEFLTEQEAHTQLNITPTVTSAYWQQSTERRTR